MDQVQESKEPVVITKHGKPVVKVIPVSAKEDDLFGSMAGKASIVGDLINTVPPADWEEL
jgi:antitoxin (DNA-binding transcriptional repressor) of toxin-antitoxin stability system